MDNTKDIIAELAAYKNITMHEARKLIADFYGKTTRTIYNWSNNSSIYEYGMIVEAVKQIKEGKLLHDSLSHDRFTAAKQAYHDYEGYDSAQERVVMMFFAFECMDGSKTFTEKQLIEKTKVPRSTLFKCLARLEEKGMVFRQKAGDGSGVEYRI